MNDIPETRVCTLCDQPWDKCTCNEDHALRAYAEWEAQKPYPHEGQAKNVSLRSRGPMVAIINTLLGEAAFGALAVILWIWLHS